MNPQRAGQHWFDDVQLDRLGAGHIHDTYLAVTGGEEFVLQRINSVVFTDPGLVMAQTHRLLAQWRQQSIYAAPELIASKRGALGEWVDGEYWRVWGFLADTIVVDPIESIAQARAAGRAFAELQASLAQMQGPTFRDPIEGFLQLDHYLQDYDNLAGAAPAGLRALVQAHRHLAVQFAQRNAHIHGDCKINNLLFDPVGEHVVAVIDFDTAMYGHWAWDFGDLVRSVCFSRGRVDVEYFAACLTGFAEHQPLTSAAESVAAPGYVALMLGVRFLSDHLNNDRYFRVARHGENLTRAEEQFALFESFEGLRGELVDAAAEVCAGA